MPRLKLWIVLAAVLALVAVGPTGIASASSVASADQATSAAVDEAALMNLINAERSAAGLPPVVANDTLAEAAQGYADYMAEENFFAHKGLDGSTLVTRAEAAGYSTWSFLAENLAAGQPTPKRVVEAWMKSPTHRANVLAPDAFEVGFGKAYNPGSKYGVYWTMEMGRRGGAAW